ncbi:hypothetical protein [Methanohalophilus portucalensis]|uniref:Uncharacterized protein n=2 Tax=Methanohalophilus portucalensis TaxID=39664 RepID=A0A1L9C3T2_9EURY|nr:hypothetical protein [Methanohalophilus portucalensis]ATU07408.1 hypothetical protein BKM01_00610 [Methanohalophilus portucalensis]OJH49137.1 hypothetical protein MPF_1640 [Methanohalophilus portucalensis FDF-1]RNI08064.1 hypothetical protein EFE41_10455 [Methanohalophilus portucalensis FDF-1]SMH39529.1 hypothetical protein SAMN06264941_1397 [Methanohalophilus portucalensis FDF-1]
MVNKLRKISIILFISVSLLLMGISVVLAMPSIPMSVDGNITIDNEPAPVGTIVTAEIDGETVDKYVVQDDGWYMLTIEGEAEDSGKTIEFFINDKNTGITENWESGSNLKIDLAISSDISDSKSSSSSSFSNSYNNDSYTNTTSENTSENERLNNSPSSGNQNVELSEESDSEYKSNDTSNLNESNNNSSLSKETPGFVTVSCILTLVILYIINMYKRE